ncbi:dTDP-4-amino-4,6-dideoxygalactose transaminase [Flavobacterium succinicans]|uniref:dTDP-4-amino-4,6-dideoxygalactose transaminase n=1 Tax=Flavobacterium succinicans TaxID=29536 RepID=A0A1I4SC76_9FLAO|nr:aminotransferase class I/II-fold pyridoxal phosphate-dependent enzyme [Flavobacterium succinicans]SFM62069.1 dTDP-4-amino-4,6-dideoxygalactose transaminase [Flavobacterium succinicans]
MDWIYLSEPHPSGKELRYIEEALQSKRITSGGLGVQGFEEDVARFLDTEMLVCATNSGTSALHLGLLLLGVQAGDEVLCQTFTFSASVNPVFYLGATPVFVDSEPLTWNMCPEALETAIKDRMKKGKKPKAIIVVDSYGMPFQADSIQAIAAKYSIPILEDSAEALGSRYKGRPCGTLGDLGVFSFNGNKIITTSSGGALLVANEKQKERAVFLASQAREEAPHYEHHEVGYNYTMSAMAAAVGRGQMEVLEDRIEARRGNHFFYKENFDEVAGISVFSEPDADYFSNHWLSAILIDAQLTKGLTPTFFRTFLEERAIETRPLWKPMHQQSVFCAYPYYGGKVAEHLFATGLCLPSSSSLDAASRNKIHSCVGQLLTEYVGL